MSILQNIETSNNFKRSVCILGSTGSVGCSTLDLISYAPEHFEVIALTGNENVKLLIEQARKFNPKFAKWEPFESSQSDKVCSKTDVI